MIDKIFVEEFKTMYIMWLILGIGLIVYEVFGKCLRKRGKDDATFYFGEHSERRPFRNIGNINIAKIVLGILFTIFVYFNNMLIAENVGIRRMWKGMGGFVDGLPALMLTTYITLITFFGIFSKRDKGKYVSFTMDEIVEKYDIVGKLKRMSLLTVAVYIFFLISGILKNSNRYEIYFGVKSLILIYFFLYLFYFMRVIWLLIELLMTNKIEHKMLNNLYREFFFSSAKKLAKIYDEEDVREQIDYLLGRYIKSTKKVDLDNIEKIIFDTNFKRQDKERFERLKIRSTLYISIFVMVLCVYPNLSLLIGKNRFQFIIVNIIGTLIFIFAGIKFEGISTVFVGIVYDRKGYQISYGKKNRYVCDVGIFENNKYFEFVKTTKSLLAFAWLMLEADKDKEFFAVVNACKIVEKECNEVKMISIILAYIYYQKKEKYSNDINLQLKNDSEKKYIQFAKAFILDIDCHPIGDKILTDKVDNYLKKYNDFSKNRNT